VQAVQPLLAILAATLAAVALAALLAAALIGRGPLHGRFLSAEQRRARPKAGTGRASPIAGVAISSSVRLLNREDRSKDRTQSTALRSLRPAEDQLDEVLRGSFAAETFDRAVRVLVWSFILAVLLAVSVGQLWRPVEPQIFATLALAGAFVLVVHELMPSRNLGTLRILLEASATIVFLTMLVLLTGDATSPFFFMYPLLVGGAALIARPRVTAVLTLETLVAYGVTAVSGYMNGDSTRDSLVRVGINMAALLLLAYAGMVMSRVQRRTREAAIRLSTVDSLTDLYNRAFLFNAVDREIQRSLRFRRGFCLLMMDLDGLKSINDRYGHYQGDLVLRAVAHVIRNGLRVVDMPARYGGDEFVALLPETDPAGAYLVGEKIRRGVKDLTVETGGHTITTSLSIGVVAYPDDGETADELMIAADQAMYSSKRLGKNRVVGYAHPGDRRRVSAQSVRPFSRDRQPHDLAPGERPGEGPPKGQGETPSGEVGGRGCA